MKFIVRESRLFVAQRFNRIEASGAIRWVESEADADRGADKKAGDGPAKREDNIYLEPSCQKVAGDNSKNDSQNSTGFRDEHGFGEELTQHIATAGADRFADTNFFCPLGNAYQHDVHNADPGRQ